MSIGSGKKPSAWLYLLRSVPGKTLQFFPLSGDSNSPPQRLLGRSLPRYLQSPFLSIENNLPWISPLDFTSNETLFRVGKLVSSHLRVVCGAFLLKIAQNSMIIEPSNFSKKMTHM